MEYRNIYKNSARFTFPTRFPFFTPSTRYLRARTFVQSFLFVAKSISFFDYVKTPLLIFVNMRSVIVFSLLLFTSFLPIIDARYWIPMYKKETPCKLEKIFDNFKHFKTY